MVVVPGGAVVVSSVKLPPVPGEKSMEAGNTVPAVVLTVYPPPWDKRVSDPPLTLKGGTGTPTPTVLLLGVIVTGPIRLRPSEIVTLPFAADVTLTVSVAATPPTVGMLLVHVSPNTRSAGCAAATIRLRLPLACPTA